MENITIMYPISSGLHILHPISSRLFYKIFSEEDRVNVTFDSSAIVSYMKVANEYGSDKENLILKNSNIDPSSAAFMNDEIRRFDFIHTFSTSNDNIIDSYIEKIKTDIVLVSACTVYDCNFIKRLINHNFRVVLGGIMVNIYGTDKVRDFLKLIGTDSDKVNKNLIIIEGNLDVNVPLYDIILKWKDYKIVENDFSTIWDCDEDYLTPFVYFFDKVYPDDVRQIMVLFTNKCWYGKCKFCMMGNMPSMNTLDGLTEKDDDKVVSTVVKLVNTLKTKRLNLIDPYFVPNKQSLRVIKKIREVIPDISIMAYTNVKSLLIDRNIDMFNEYFDFIKVGLESLSDYALQTINKQHRYNDVLDLVEKFPRFNKNMEFQWLLLEDIPLRDADDVRENYRRIVEFKNSCLEYFNYSQVILNPYLTFPGLSLNDSKHLKIAETVEEKRNIIGMRKVTNFLEKALGFPFNISERIMPPMVRYDINNNILPSDFDIVPPETIGFITRC